MVGSVGWLGPRNAAAVAAPAVAALPVTQTPGLRELVPAGETVILAIRPSFWFVILKPLERVIAVLVLAAVGYLIGDMGWMKINPTLAMAAGLFAGSVLVLYAAADWLTRMYLLTDRRVMRVSGIVRQVTFDAPLCNIQNVVLYRSTRERVFGLGTVAFTTAGATIGEFSWFMIGRPVETVRIVRDTLQRYGHLEPGQVRLKPPPSAPAEGTGQGGGP